MGWKFHSSKGSVSMATEDSILSKPKTTIRTPSKRQNSGLSAEGRNFIDKFSACQGPIGTMI